MPDNKSLDVTKVAAVRLECRGEKCGRARVVPIADFLEPKQILIVMLADLCPKHCDDMKIAMANTELTRLNNSLCVLAEMAVGSTNRLGIPVNILLVPQDNLA